MWRIDIEEGRNEPEAPYSYMKFVSCSVSNPSNFGILGIKAVSLPIKRKNSLQIGPDDGLKRPFH